MKEVKYIKKIALNLDPTKHKKKKLITEHGMKREVKEVVDMK